MTLRARAPTRIDLSGGMIDLWPVYLLIPKAATVNLAIDLYTEVEVEPSPDQQWHVRERVSKRTSSADSTEALAEMEGAEIAGALNGLTGFRYGNLELIELVKDVEVELLRMPTGAQDHYPPVFGGAMCLWWEKLRHRREPLPIDAGAFRERFLLAYSHQPHRSGATNWEVVKRFFESDPTTTAAVERSGRTAAAVRDALVDGDLDRVAVLIGEDWQARREMAPAVSSPELETIIAAAREAGVTAEKVCGAGGGGCMILAVPEGKRSIVSAAVAEAGGSVLDYNVAPRGLELIIE